LSSAIETTTGPLGQGSPTAWECHRAEYLAADSSVPVTNSSIITSTPFVSDGGDLMEGGWAIRARQWQVIEAGRLIYLYDRQSNLDDGQHQSGLHRRPRRSAFELSLARSDGRPTPLPGRDRVRDQNAKGRSAPLDHLVKRSSAMGSPNKAGTAKAHGEPLGVEEVKLTKQNLGWPYEEPFTVPTRR